MSTQYVGIDLHRRRSVIVRMTAEGDHLDQVQMDNDPVALALQIAEVGPDPEVVLEATTAGTGRSTSCRPRAPKPPESDTTVRRGPITKQGSRLVRWAAVEAIQPTRAGTKLSADKTRIVARRGRNIAKIATARKLLTLVYSGLRDGEIRALGPRGRRERNRTQPTRVVHACHDPHLARSPI